jgi:transposase InsO family protein
VPIEPAIPAVMSSAVNATEVYTSIRFTQRLAEAGAVPSVGSVGDAYDDALAETTIGLTRPNGSTEVGRGATARPSRCSPSTTRQPLPDQ